MAETVGDYFKQLLEAENMGEYMFVLSYDQFRGDWEIAHYSHWEPLGAHVASVIAEHLDEPFQGPTSCAMVMNYAAERLLAKERLKPPKGWLPTIKTLWALGGMSGSKPKA